MLAYIDPGAGSLVFQALLAALAGAIVTVKTQWTRIKRLLGRRGSAGEPPDGDRGEA